MGIKPTNEQIDIVKAPLEHESLKINAFSGTGKTTVLEFIANTYHNKKILYLCYGKAMQLSSRKKFPANVEVRTIHSLAYGGIIRYKKDVRLKEMKIYRAYDISKKYDISNKSAKKVLFIFNSFCKSTSKTIKVSGVDAEERALAQNLFEQMKTGNAEPSQEFYIKYFGMLLEDKEISTKYYAIALLDEAQDVNELYLSIFQQINANRKIYVGDKHQQIYSFNYSVNAMAKINAPELNLTETFRFHKGIARLANDLLSRFKKEQIRIISNIEEDKENVCDEVAYICRTNASLIKQMALLHENGFKFKTVSDPKKIFTLAIDMYNFINNQKNLITKNTFLLDKNSIDEVITYAEESEENEILRTIELCIEYKSKIVFLSELAENYFDNTEYENETNRNYLTTAHTAKGKEWEKVILDDDFSLASYLIAKAGYQDLKTFIENIHIVDSKIIDEFNLLYVALTRAKLILDYDNCTAISFINMDEDVLDFKINKDYQKIQQSKRNMNYY